jgi:predicted AAA+ superfamily ATPase
MPGVYVRRIIDADLDKLLEGLPAVALEGAKGVGKTATASQRATRIVRLDVEAERTAFAAAPFDLVPEGTLLLDEWHRYPSCWDQVRRAVDDGAPPGSFILAGSSAPRGAAIHSGAGRIVIQRLRPLSLAERGLEEPTVSLSALLAPEKSDITGSTSVALADYVAEIFNSGFPGIRPLGPRLREERLEGYINATVQREFAEQGVIVRRPETLLAWLRAFAAATASTASYTSILDAATAGLDHKPGRDTTAVYRDVLQRAFVLDSIAAWIPWFNPLKRLATSPKHYLADPALATVLLGLDAANVMRGTDAPQTAVNQRPMLGPLFEHLVAQSVLVYAQAVGAHVGHLRQLDARHEIDLIVERGQRAVAIEVKLAQTVGSKDVRHLLWLKSELGDGLADMVVVTTGPYAYRRPDGVAVVPAALLGP